MVTKPQINFSQGSEQHFAGEVHISTIVVLQVSSLNCVSDFMEMVNIYRNYIRTKQVDIFWTTVYICSKWTEADAYSAF